MLKARWFGFQVLTATLIVAGGAAAESNLVPRSTKQARVQCVGAVRHPIDVRVVPLDPVRRDATLRVRVITTSRVALDRAEVQLVSADGGTPQGATRIAQSVLVAGRDVASDFAVRLPAQGQRFLLQFRVTAYGPNGRITRGASLNLLPDGPTDLGRLVTAGNGQQIVEHSAHRIGQ